MHMLFTVLWENMRACVIDTVMCNRHSGNTCVHEELHYDDVSILKKR